MRAWSAHPTWLAIASLLIPDHSKIIELREIDRLRFRVLISGPAIRRSVRESIARRSIAWGTCPPASWIVKKPGLVPKRVRPSNCHIYHRCRVTLSAQPSVCPHASEE